MSKILATTALVTMLGGTFITAPAEAHHHFGHHHHHHHALRYPVRAVFGIKAMVTRIAAEEGVPAALAHGVIRVESGYNCAARNGSAVGIGQLLRSTARALGVRNPMDCVQNLRGSMRYLRMAISRYGYGCTAASAYQSGLGVGRCSSYGRKVLRFAYTG